MRSNVTNEPHAYSYYLATTTVRTPNDEKNVNDVINISWQMLYRLSAPVGSQAPGTIVGSWLQ